VPHDALTDEALMLAVQGGDVDRLSSLFERYHRQLFAFFYQMLRDRSAAEDLVQDVFVRVLKYRRTFQPETSFKAWIFHIARNSRHDFVRKHPPAGGTVDDAMASFDAGVGAQLEKDDETALLRRALSRLSADKRELIILARYRGMSYEELAALMEVDQGTVRVRLHRAIRQLGDVFHELRGTTRHAL
jgi:RNA polymerase sigma-70 factor (ECF subfamily)